MRTRRRREREPRYFLNSLSSSALARSAAVGSTVAFFVPPNNASRSVRA
jgi:hypothetical protein